MEIGNKVKTLIDDGSLFSKGDVGEILKFHENEEEAERMLKTVFKKSTKLVHVNFGRGSNPIVIIPDERLELATEEEAKNFKPHMSGTGSSRNR